MEPSIPSEWVWRHLIPYMVHGKADEPIILPDPDPHAWNSMCTTNPAFVQVSDDEFRLYYKSWCIKDWEYDLVHGDGVKTNRQYGLATASTIDGPWKKVGDKPIIDLRFIGKNAQSEDAYIWIEDNTIK